jgi:pSer/pThr/pTyr-binding forkhead associated (FHA) protein
MPEPLILKVVTGNQAGREIAIPASGAVFGRASDCEITLGEPTISRKHCRFALEKGEWVVRDLDSHSGTIVNGRLANVCPLKPGDEVTLGHLRLKVVTIPTTSPFPRAKPSSPSL